MGHTTTRHSHEGIPHWLCTLTEWRALFEAALLPYAALLLRYAPRGDGHPVLLLPGFMADEVTMFALKWMLRRKGYDVQTWGFGRNLGFQRRHAQALEQKIRFMHYRSGRKVSLVGWSLGGLFAFYGAYQVPECVRSVVTLGSPINMDETGSQTPPLMQALYRLIAHPWGPNAHAVSPHTRLLRKKLKPPVPTSCLFSLGDGVVPPQEATIDCDPQMHENIRVLGSHIGLGFNAMVMYIIADRLAQREGRWRAFRPQGVLKQIYRVTRRAAPAPA
jgi:pimeloyl-ACP methyl ester carboxylesterase